MLNKQVWGGGRSALLMLSLLTGANLAWAQGRTGAKLPLEEYERLASAMSIIKSDYVAESEERKLIDGCIKGMVGSLDGDSGYMDRQSMAQFRQGASSPVGVGVELEMRGGFPVVVAPFADSPAERAGLKPGDVIVGIDDEQTEDLPMQDIVMRLRGDAGSSVTVKLRGQSGRPARSVSMARARILPPTVQSSVVAPGVVHLRVRQFLENTPSSVIAELDKIRKKGALNGIVLDLRNSPGGLLSSSIELAAMLLPEDALIASTTGRLADAQQTFRANPLAIDRLDRQIPAPWPAYLRTVPLIVLVNQGTASGSEIVAAALRDNGRARLVGSKTFGRGSIQTVRALGPDAAIKLTTAMVLTPAGQTFHRKGLEPDVLAPDLQSALEVGTPADKAMLKALDILAGKV